MIRNKLKYLLAGVLVLAGCALVGIGHTNKQMTIPKSGSEFAKTAVMITSENMRSGGTGVILESRPGMSLILTNKHVCQLVQVGGRVITDNGRAYPVESFRVYKKHDLCLITVFKNLGINIKLAKRPPVIYSGSVVVGHPALMPTMITSGHFSQWQAIQLVVDMKACDGKEENEEALMCMFVGAKPVVKEFQAQATSSLIMPGSSGSAVFNESGELSGLIFAGSEGLSYGYLVPWEYVNDFLGNLSKYPSQTPNPSKKPSNFFAAYFKLEKICGDKVSSVMNISNICHNYANLGLWHE